MIIVLAGPAASDKGTLAKILAKELNLPHYDFGLIFRAIDFLNTRFTLEKFKIL
jgi:cytidylate kinase